MVDRILVFTEIPPVLLFEPCAVSGHPHASVTSGRCAREFLIPTASYSVAIKPAILQIPITSQDNLYALVVQVSIEVRNSSFQRVGDVFPREGCGHGPQAELLAFQASFAVGNQWFEEIH